MTDIRFVLGQHSALFRPKMWRVYGVLPHKTRCKIYFFKFVSSLSDIFKGTVQYNGELPGMNVEELCKAMTTEAGTAYNRLQKLIVEVSEIPNHGELKVSIYRVCFQDKKREWSFLHRVDEVHSNSLSEPLLLLSVSVFLCIWMVHFIKIDPVSFAGNLHWEFVVEIHCRVEEYHCPSGDGCGYSPVALPKLCSIWIL